MNATKDIAYFLASPEAIAHIEALFSAMDAYKDAYKAFGETLGATNTITLSHRVVGFEFRDKPLPKGWKAPAKSRRFPPHSAVGPKGWDADLPPFPSKEATDQALGIGPVVHFMWEEEGTLRGADSSYGYEKVGSNYVITVRVVNGTMHGNPPTGCQPLKKSEYFALKGE